VKTAYTRGNRRSLGKHAVRPEEEKERLQREGFAEKGGFKSGMKERVGDEKLIIISVGVTAIATTVLLPVYIDYTHTHTQTEQPRSSRDTLAGRQAQRRRQTDTVITILRRHCRH